MKKAIFLDRDGNVNVDHGYINHPDNLHLIEGSGTAIAQLNRANWLVFLISNQSGVARGVIHEKALQAIQAKLRQELAAYNAHLDAEFLCLHHPKGKVPHLSYDCNCRKPKQQFFHDAQTQFDFDPAESWMVGDKPSDITFGKRAGMKTALVLTGYGRGELRYFRNQWPDMPDLIATNLYELVRFLLNDSSLPQDFAVATPWPGSFHFRIENEEIVHASFSSNSNCNMPSVAPPLAWETAMQIEEYFAGERQQFFLPLKISGTEFEQKVWEVLQDISYGSTITYQELAQFIHKPQGARAVGNALHKNQLQLLLPCHRVLSQKGLGDYAAGSTIKQFLLNLEMLSVKCE